VLSKLVSQRDFAILLERLKEMERKVNEPRSKSGPQLEEAVWRALPAALPGLVGALDDSAALACLESLVSLVAEELQGLCVVVTLQINPTQPSVF
jgi:hypothetical protein